MNNKMVNVLFVIALLIIYVKSTTIKVILFKQLVTELPVNMANGSGSDTWHPHLKKNWVNQSEFLLEDNHNKLYPTEMSFIQMANSNKFLGEPNILNNSKMKCACRFVKLSNDVNKDKEGSTVKKRVLSSNKSDLFSNSHSMKNLEEIGVADIRFKQIQSDNQVKPKEIENFTPKQNIQVNKPEGIIPVDNNHINENVKNQNTLNNQYMNSPQIQNSNVYPSTNTINNVPTNLNKAQNYPNQLMNVQSIPNNFVNTQAPNPLNQNQIQTPITHPQQDAQNNLLMEILKMNNQLMGKIQNFLMSQNQPITNNNNNNNNPNKNNNLMTSYIQNSPPIQNNNQQPVMPNTLQSIQPNNNNNNNINFFEQFAKNYVNKEFINQQNNNNNNLNRMDVNPLFAQMLSNNNSYLQ